MNFGVGGLLEGVDEVGDGLGVRWGDGGDWEADDLVGQAFGHR